jgi:uncharacterized protein DUF5681
MTRAPRYRRGKAMAVEPTYEVGYGKPPKHTQFKAGQSGNPKGRPRNQQNLKTVIEGVLKEKITIREGEKTRTVSRLDAIVRLTINRALQGETKSLAAFLQLLRPTGLMEEKPETLPQESVSAEDEAILGDFLARHGIFDQVPNLGAATGHAAKSADPKLGAASELKGKDYK